MTLKTPFSTLFHAFPDVYLNLALIRDVSFSETASGRYSVIIRYADGSERSLTVSFADRLFFEKALLAQQKQKQPREVEENA